MRSKWNRAKAAIEFEQHQLDRLIEPHFPDSRVVDWQQTEGGLANTNIRLRLNNRTEPVLLRLFMRDPKQAAKEWSINGLVHHCVPSPKFLYFASDNAVTGHPYILMEWIDGVRMESVLLDLQGHDVEALGHSVGSALAAIHSYRFEKAGFIDAQLKVIDPIDLGAAGLISYASQCLIDGIGKERLGMALTNRLLDFLKSESQLLDEWHGQPCLSHSDFGGSNILVSKDAGSWKVAAVLDWEFAFSGTPFVDFGNLLRAPHGTVPNFQDSVLKGYKGAGGQVPEKWLQMSRLTDLFAWMDFVTRDAPGESLINDARQIICQTIDEWSA
jgi:aminoglycoside phosphotransferase (APT) family kinase protein